MFKFGIGQIIYYMKNNKPHSAPVLARRKVEDHSDNHANTQEQKSLFTPFGPSGTEYYTCHGVFAESNTFDSLDGLLDSLRS